MSRLATIGLVAAGLVLGAFAYQAQVDNQDERSDAHREAPSQREDDEGGQREPQRPHPHGLG